MKNSRCWFHDVTIHVIQGVEWTLSISPRARKNVIASTLSLTLSDDADYRVVIGDSLSQDCPSNVLEWYHVRRNIHAGLEETSMSQITSSRRIEGPERRWSARSTEGAVQQAPTISPKLSILFIPTTEAEAEAVRFQLLRCKGTHPINAPAV